jgi:hypothetical protein
MKFVGFTQIAVKRGHQIVRIKAGQAILIFAAGMNGGQSLRANLRIPGIFVHVEAGAVAYQRGGDEAARQHGDHKGKDALTETAPA